MNKRAIHTILFLIIAVALLGCATGKVREAAPPEITAVDVMDNAVALKVSGEFGAASYTVYKPSDPYLVVVDLPGVGVAPGVKDTMVSDKPGTTEIRLIRTETPTLSTKVEIRLDSPADVVPEYSDGTLTLAVEKAAASEMPVPETSEEAGEPMETAQATEQEPLQPATEINDFKFDYSDGTLKFVIQGNGSMSPQVFKMKERVIVDVPGVTMEASLPEAVVSPVKAVRYGKYDGSVRIVVELKKPVEVSASAEDASVVLSMPAEEVPVIEKSAAPAAEEEAEEAERAPKEKYAGKMISLDFQNADIVPIFRFIGDVAGLNVVVHPNVKGRITLKLMNVPWDQALDIILQTFNLGKSIEGNVMTIAPAGVFAEWQEKEAELKAAKVKAAELRQAVIRVNYAEASDVQSAIKGAKVMSPRGNLTVDKRMNTIIVNDTDQNIGEIRKLVAIIDVPKPQVMIEAKIVEVDNTFTRTLGIRWGGTYKDNIRQPSGDVAGGFSVNTPVGSFGPSAGTETAPKAGVDFLIGSAADSVQLDLSLEALETVGKSRKLANPRVLTIDGETANIQQGTSIPVQTTTAEGTQTEFVNANLNLQVTPRITPDGYIQLKVIAANDSPGDVTPGGIAINRKNVSTQAIVKNGETLVIGGIYTTTDSKTDTGVPLLSKIPVLGWLFKTRSDLRPQNELLILITPRVVERTDRAAKLY
jgi:type IV pilus assembly protein PilQ